MSTNPRKLLQVSACALLLAAFAAPASAAGNAEKFRVNLIATIDDDPAMENVEWVVYRNGSEAVKTARKHSTHVNIPPGKYKVVARLTSDKSIVRTRNFHVRNNTQVVVPMDH